MHTPCGLITVVHQPLASTARLPWQLRSAGQLQGNAVLLLPYTLYSTATGVAHHVGGMQTRMPHGCRPTC